MGSYKNRSTDSTVSAISDAISDLTSLGEECREIVDNASENLQQTSRIQTFDETASALEGLSEPDVPECVAELPITYSEQISTRKGRGESRAVRCANSVAVLQAAQEAVAMWLEDETNEEHAERDEVEQLANDIEEIIGEAEGCEFPGMYG